MEVGGLSERDIAVIKEAISRHPGVEKALLFGSRAKGNYTRGSDVDIALFGAELGASVTRISGYLNEESPLPYFFDVLDYDAITNDMLREHINRVGIELYRR